MTDATPRPKVTLDLDDLLVGGALVDKHAAPLTLCDLAELPRAVFDPRRLVWATVIRDDRVSSDE